MKRLADYSQYFLRSPQLVKALIGHTNIKKTDIVYDIGAGSGVITAMLARRCRHVYAVEYEPRMAAKLRETMRTYTNVTVVQGDALTIPLPIESYKIVANIPFHLSSPIVRRFTEAENPPEALYLVVQKQFAYKLLIDRGQFTGMLGAMIAPRYTVRVRKHLERTDFWPHPAVDTVFVELSRRETPLVPHEQMSSYRACVEQCYARQKFFESIPRASFGVPPSLRPSQMTASQWVTLFQGIHARQHKK